VEDLKVDNEELKMLAELAMKFHRQIQSHLDCLESENEDIFLRYTAYIWCKNYLLLNKTLGEINRNSFVAGHDIGHEIFNTEKARENGWDIYQVNERNPFFINKNNGSSKEWDEKIKKIIKESLDE
jgi:hypothetical protein